MYLVYWDQIRLVYQVRSSHGQYRKYSKPHLYLVIWLLFFARLLLTSLLLLRLYPIQYTSRELDRHLIIIDIEFISLSKLFFWQGLNKHSSFLGFHQLCIVLDETRDSFLVGEKTFLTGRFGFDPAAAIFHGHFLHIQDAVFQPDQRSR